MTRPLAFSRLLVRTVGVPTLRSLIPIYCGLAVAAAVLFGPTGMSASTVVTAIEASPRFGVGVWLAWLALVTAPTRQLFHQRDALYLRAWPVAPAAQWSLLLVLALAVQLPWTWLWLRGAGLMAASAATVVAAALTTLIAIRPRYWLETAVVVVVFAGLITATIAGLFAWQLAALGAGVLVLAARAAWQRAPERRSGVELTGLIGGSLGLTVIYAAAVWRQHRSSLARGAVLAVAGGALTGMIARNNQIVAPAEVGGLALAAAAIVVTFASAMVAGPIVDAERAMRWLVTASGSSAEHRLLSAAAVSCASSAVYAGIFVAMITVIAPLSVTAVVRVSAGCLALAVAVGLLSLWAARWSERADGVDGARLVAAIIGIVLVSVAMCGVAGEWALVLMFAGATKLTLGRSNTSSSSSAERWRT